MPYTYQTRNTSCFEEAPRAEVSLFPWDCTFQPKTCARLTWTEDAFYVFMSTTDPDPRAEAAGLNGPVYLDNCMEFFFMPDPEHSSNYINWEFNQKGSLFLSLGSHRFDRVNLMPPDHMKLFHVQVARAKFPTECSGNAPADASAGIASPSLAETSEGWTLQYRIPFSFIRKYFPYFRPEAGHQMRGNFYKCGDGCAMPHYACWSPIDLPAPDFHCPDFFGDLIME